ncbi:MAG: LysR substrate-binding domain-containing protein [Sneathiella sp.]
MSGSSKKPTNEPYLSKEVCRDDTVICVGRDYIQNRERPRIPEDLPAMDFITFGQTSNRYTKLEFENEEHSAAAVTVHGRLSFSSMKSVYEAVLNNLGVGCVPRYLAKQDLENGSLVELLPTFRIRPVNFHAFYTQRRKDNILVSKFIEFVKTGVAAI